ncbi:MAG: sulfite exporter TauE/SafE family protein [bacterium]|nr:MAG: sulfite exporter TauE/SafE family protein [bacterium]
MEYVVIFVIAIITSAASACVGLGGGLLLIPFLILVFDLPVKFVAGTMLFAMIPYTLVATWGNLRNGYVNLKIGLVMESGAIIGVLWGAFFTDLFPDLLLKLIFVFIVFYLMLTLRIPTGSPYNFIARGFNAMNLIPPFIACKTAQDARCSIPSLVILGIVAGFFSGLLGIGGGFLNTPVLIVGVLLAPKVAVGTSLFMILITSLFGTAEHALLGHINYAIALVVTPGMMIGAYIGIHLLKNLAEEKIKTFIFVAMFVAGIMALFR